MIKLVFRIVLDEVTVYVVLTAGDTIAVVVVLDIATTGTDVQAYVVPPFDAVNVTGELGDTQPIAELIKVISVGATRFIVEEVTFLGGVFESTTVTT